jgi:hypothetical protein
MQTFNIVILVALGERILRPEQRSRLTEDGEVVLEDGEVVLEDDPDSRARKVCC